MTISREAVSLQYFNTFQKISNCKQDAQGLTLAVTNRFRNPKKYPQYFRNCKASKLIRCYFILLLDYLILLTCTAIYFIFININKTTL